MEALGMLGYPIDPEADSRLVAERARWVLERERIVEALRVVCADHGDNDWMEQHSLADVVEKHLGRHLDQTAERRAKSVAIAAEALTFAISPREV
jgi:hypothetical protein